MKKLVLAFGWMLFTATADADWLEFRGTNGASSVDAELPIEFGGESETGLAWKVPLPGRAVNGPVVVNGQVITTCSSGNRQKRLHVVSVDDQTGKIQWSRRFWATGRTLCHPLSAIAAPTPVTDGTLVYAFFASNDLVTLDLSGNVVWVRALGLDYPSAFDDRGLASSPCLVGETLVVQIACEGDSFAFGLDKETGNTVWKVPLAKSTNWASPTRLQLDGQELVMVQSADRLHDARSRQPARIRYRRTRPRVTSSPHQMVIDGICIACQLKGMTALNGSRQRSTKRVRCSGKRRKWRQVRPALRQPTGSFTWCGLPIF